MITPGIILFWSPEADHLSRARLAMVQLLLLRKFLWRFQIKKSSGDSRRGPACGQIVVGDGTVDGTSTRSGTSCLPLHVVDTIDSSNEWNACPGCVFGFVWPVVDLGFGFLIGLCSVGEVSGGKHVIIIPLSLSLASALPHKLPHALLHATFFAHRTNPSTTCFLRCESKK